ncbi:M23 family metallopeptidase [Agromyces sp. NPDC056523]|uniref:M23 family metallopeptidase n=1 Tax=Agromyces sp. NPDC056523 TaxID=3345850 RepID=UPI00366ED4DB
MLLRPRRSGGPRRELGGIAVVEWQDFYRAGGNAFGKLGPFYGPGGHRGRDFVHDAGTAVPAYLRGTVVKIQTSTAIGRCVVVRLDEGRFAGWAHLREIEVSINDTVRPGDTIARVAGANDSPGSSWDGAHSHTTLGPNEDSIFSGAVENPMNLITPALIAAGARGEEDMFSDIDRNRLNNVWAGLFKGASVEVDEGVVKRFAYGVLPIVAHNQTLIAQQSARIAALEEALSQLAQGTGVQLDQGRIDDVVNAVNDARKKDFRRPVVEDLDSVDGIEVMNAGESGEPADG